MSVTEEKNMKKVGSIHTNMLHIQIESRDNASLF